MTNLAEQLLWIQLWTGAPIYVFASTCQGLWLQRSGHYKWPAIVSSALFCTAIAVIGGVVVWVKILGPIDIMLYGAINLAALIASAVIFPLIGALGVALGRSSNRQPW